MELLKSQVFQRAIMKQKTLCWYRDALAYPAFSGSAEIELIEIPASILVSQEDLEAKGTVTLLPSVES
jgi:hypothetical protein